MEIRGGASVDMVLSFSQVEAKNERYRVGQNFRLSRSRLIRAARYIMPKIGGIDKG
jgi:hypothetical protein